MASKSWTLIDSENDVFVDEMKADDLGSVASSLKGCAFNRRVLAGGLRDGVDEVTLDNGKIRVSILPTRGMSIWKAWAGDTEFGWRSPVRGPVHPQFVPLAEPSGLGWLDGFDELLVRCGLESNGAPEFNSEHQLVYPLHGRIGNRPAHDVRVEADGDKGELRLIGVVEETRFHFLKLRLTSTIVLSANRDEVTIQDEVQNLSANPAEFQLLYHVNFGAPLLDAGARFIAPVKTVVPRNARAAEGISTWNSYLAPEPAFEEQVYFLELLADQGNQSEAMLTNAHGTLAALMRFDAESLPCYSLWKNTTALEDGYVTGLEPGTNFPNPRTFEGQKGRVAKLDGRASRTFNLTLRFLTATDDVQQAEDRLNRLQQSVKPQVHEQPQSDWCAPPS